MNLRPNNDNKKTIRRENLMGCPIDVLSFDETIIEIIRRIKEKKATSVVHFLNVAKIVKARKNIQLQKALWDGDLVLADGKPLLPFARRLGIYLSSRVNGTDLMEKLMAVSEKEKFRIYLLGAKQDILERCVKNIRKKHPNIQIVGYRNGYFSKNKIKDIIQQINTSHPDLLFIGMGTPQKELFAYENKDKLRVSIVQGAGGNFDVFAGLTKRAPKWMQNYGLEWLYRILQEPRRLFWRYFSTNLAFLMIYVKQILFNSKDKI